MNTTATRLKKVKPRPNVYTLHLTWDDGRKQTANLTGLINRSKHFRVFLDDPDAFEKVSVINWGDGVGWENGLDYAADNLGRIADEQEQWDAKQFRVWQKALELSNQETADVLGYGIGQIKNFRSGKARIPVTVSTTCRTLGADKAIFFAHYVPRKPGRPKKQKNA